jgi:diguanylate cyclase (GGDEF)-like protein/PAS domain S-box-containing protein
MTAVKQINSNAQTLDVNDAFKPYEAFCRAMIDAYVVIDEQGRCVKFNQLLCNLTGLKSKQIMRAESFDDVISFYVGDKQLHIKDIINQQAPTRFDEVRGSIPGDNNLNLIMGVYPFKDLQDKTLGAFMIIRDVTAETNLQGKYKDAQSKSITDPLTTLFTRGYFEDYLKLQTKTLLELPANSDQRMISLIMVDIDHFKKVNDVHGHQAGDYILKQAAEVMKKSFRKTDIICRYGGEEFLIILPATDLKGSAAAAEKLRANVEAEKIVFEETHIPITISLGIAQINLGMENHNDTIARADSALYEAKRSGRNRVKIAP